MDKTFVVTQTPQYGVVNEVVKKGFSIDSSIFSNVYQGCIKSVEDIIQQNKDTKQNLEIEPFINPIIAITGSRGSGKSSAMHSFAQYLKDSKKYSDEIKKYTGLEDAFFSVLPPIDATQFGKNESVISNISAAMYREYKKISDTLSVDQKRDFVSLAKAVNDTSVVYTTGEWFKRDECLLQDAEKVGNLRKDLHTLIEKYLKLQRDSQNNNNNYLVIMLDDLDMCTKGAFAIIEEIRKFLCIKNIIIIMTLQSEQLKTLLQTSYAESLSGYDKGDSTVKAHVRPLIQDLAYRTFEKMFPSSRCHSMPIWNADILNSFDLSVVDSTGNDVYGDKQSPSDLLYKALPESTRSKIIYRTLHLIWRKTMLLLVCNKENEHLLLPNNLRSLHNFIVMLNSMEEVIDLNSIKQPLPTFIPGYLEFNAFIEEDNAFINRETLQKNLDLFENYLMENIHSYGNIKIGRKSEQDFADTLVSLIYEMKLTPLCRLNAKVVGDILDADVSFIGDAFDKQVKIGDTTKSLKNLLQDAVAHADTISVGDVMFVLGKIDVRTRCRYISYLVEVIRTLWSIRMTKEFFINGKIRKNRSGNLYASYITKDFRIAVGALMVDANATSFFPSKCAQGKRSGDWFVLSKDKEKNFEFYKLFQTSYISEIPNNNKYPKEGHNYRKHSPTGIPNYLTIGLDDINAGTIIYHPLAIYTNLLNYYEGAPDINIFTHPLESIVMTFPFYSLDYLYRFYEIFRKKLKKISSNTNSLIQSFLKVNDIYNQITLIDVDYDTNILKIIGNHIPTGHFKQNYPINAKLIIQKICEIAIDNLNIDIVDKMPTRSIELAVSLLDDFDVVSEIEIISSVLNKYSQSKNKFLEDALKASNPEDLLNWLKAELIYGEIDDAYRTLDKLDDEITVKDIETSIKCIECAIAVYSSFDLDSKRLCCKSDIKWERLRGFCPTRIKDILDKLMILKEEKAKQPIESSIDACV